MNNKIIVTLLLLFVSTNSFAQELAIKSNIPYLATASPNIGLEIGISQKITLDISYGINPFTFNDKKKWKHWLTQPEMRYWFCERFYGHFIGLHAGVGEYNVNHQDFRYEGWAAMGGLSYGYSWILGRRWNMEATLGIGLVHTDYKKFECIECGKLLGENNKTFFAPTKVGINIIYMLK